METEYTYEAASELEMPALPARIDAEIPLGGNHLWAAYLKKYDSTVEGIKLSTDGKILSVHIQRTDLESLKDQALLSVCQTLLAENLYLEDGGVVPTSKALVLYGTKVVPLTHTMGVNKSNWIEQIDMDGKHRPSRSAHLNVATKVVPWTPVIGEALKDDVFTQQKILFEQTKDLHPDLQHFEEEELYTEPLGRGIYFPIMKLARLCLYDSRLYGRKVLKDMIMTSGKFLSLRDFSQVEISNPSANVGLWDLQPLAKKGTSVVESPEYYKQLQESTNLAKVFNQKSVPSQVLTVLVPPHAVGKRNQSYGRAIIMVAKVLFFIMSLWGQPLTLALERERWYASGDRYHRLQLARALLNGKISFAVDGDDFVMILEVEGKRIIIKGDYSAYESSVRKQDHLLFMRWLKQNVVNQTEWNLAYLIDNAYYIASHLAFIDGFGTILREAWQGVNSGEPTTHTEESLINASCLKWASGTHDLDTALSLLTALGRSIKKSAQYQSKGDYVILAKLISDGKVIHGSIVRAFWSLVATEGPWDIPPDQTAEEWLDGRTVAVLSNVVDHPLFDRLLAILKSTGYQLKTGVAKVTELALTYMEKRRTFSKKNVSGGVIERASIRKAVAALHAL